MGRADYDSMVKCCSYDFATFEKFLSRLRRNAQAQKHYNSPTEFIIVLVEELMEQIERELSRRDLKQKPVVHLPTLLKAVRAIVLVLLIPEIDDTRFHETFERIVGSFKLCNSRLRQAKKLP
jgi:hypothetical protein